MTQVKIFAKQYILSVLHLVHKWGHANSEKSKFGDFWPSMFKKYFTEPQKYGHTI